MPLAQRVTAGRQLGALLLAMLVLLTLVGLAIGFFTGRQRALAQAADARAGSALLALVALAVIAFAGALAVSHRGLTGQHLARLQRAHRHRTRRSPTRPGA